MPRKNLDYLTHDTRCRKLSLAIASLYKSKYRGFNDSNRDFDSKQQTRLIGQQANACLAYQRTAPAKKRNKCKGCKVNPFSGWYKKHMVYK